MADIFVQHRQQLRQIAMSIVRAADLADEIMQDAYLKLAEGSSMRSVQKPLYYCCQVVRNLAMDHFRRRTTEASYRSFGLDVEQIYHPTTVTPEKLLSEKRVIVALEQALGRLPERTRRAFELYRLQEMTQRDIAEALGCSATLVNFMIRDALDALQRCRNLLDD
nr:sigma-70 family RNA polymerase sigma factor [Duganella lactea]